MIGYEFEFLMENKKTHEPINQKEFNLFHKTLEKDGWEIGKDPITKGIVCSKKDGIKITTDDSIYVLEINLPPTKTINESDKKIKELLVYLNKIIEPLDLRILGIGMFPAIVPEDQEYTCHKAFIRYLTPRRYYLHRTLMHKIAACQYWFDIPKEKLIETTNMMNRLNGVCVAFLGNSSFSENKQNENIEERLPAWKKFVNTPHPYDKKITGIPEQEFTSFLNYLTYCLQAPFYGCAWFSGIPFYLEDHSKTNADYFLSGEIEVLLVTGERKKVSPNLGDSYDLIQKNIFLDSRVKFNFKKDATAEAFKKAYKERDESAVLALIDQSFIECRFIAAQNKEEFSIGAAFLLGLLENFEKTKELLSKHDYEYWKELREKAIKHGLDFEIDGEHITEIVDEFLQISEEGLKKRGYKEEQFLERAKEFLKSKENPGQRKVRLFSSGGIENVIEDAVL